MAPAQKPSVASCCFQDSILRPPPAIQGPPSADWLQLYPNSIRLEDQGTGPPALVQIPPSQATSGHLTLLQGQVRSLRQRPPKTFLLHAPAGT